MTRKQGHIRIGTSGWSYDHWDSVFYPENLGRERRLKYYTSHLNSVEINNSFYHLPEKETLRKWYETVPDDFVFAVKASRYITHMKKLNDPDVSVSRFIDQISTLENKLGPILFQLPSGWHYNPERLEYFLESLDHSFTYAFEFRDHSWLNQQTYELLSQYNVAFCIYELNGFQSPRQVTSDSIYVRLHGPGEAYQGNYDKRTLAGWVEAFSTWSSQGHSIYCYFDNDQAGYAAKNALSLQLMLHG